MVIENKRVVLKDKWGLSRFHRYPLLVATIIFFGTSITHAKNTPTSNNQIDQPPTNQTQTLPEGVRTLKVLGDNQEAQQSSLITVKSYKDKEMLEYGEVTEQTYSEKILFPTIGTIPWGLVIFDIDWSEIPNCVGEDSAKLLELEFQRISDSSRFSSNGQESSEAPESPKPPDRIPPESGEASTQKQNQQEENPRKTFTVVFPITNGANSNVNYESNLKENEGGDGKIREKSLEDGPTQSSQQIKTYGLLIEQGQYALSKIVIEQRSSKGKEKGLLSVDRESLLENPEMTGGLFEIHPKEAIYIGSFGLDCLDKPTLWRYSPKTPQDMEEKREAYRKQFPFLDIHRLTPRLLKTQKFGSPSLDLQ